MRFKRSRTVDKAVWMTGLGFAFGALSAHYHNGLLGALALGIVLNPFLWFNEQELSRDALFEDPQ